MFLLFSREQLNGSSECLAWNNFVQYSAIFELLIYHNNILSKCSAKNNATVTVTCIITVIIKTQPGQNCFINSITDDKSVWW